MPHGSMHRPTIRRTEFFVRHVDFVLLICSAIPSFGIAAFTSRVVGVTGEVRIDWSQLISQGSLLSMLLFIAGEVVRIKSDMAVINRDVTENTKEIQAARAKSEAYNLFNDKLIQMLNHEDEIVRSIIPTSVISLFHKARVDSNRVDLECDYFGAEAYVQFLRKTKDLQAANPSLGMVLRATHSASLKIWAERQELATIEGDFTTAFGTIYRIIIKHRDSPDDYARYNEVIKAMTDEGVSVFFYDLTGEKAADIHDYLLCHLDDKYYSMRWLWDSKPGERTFGQIMGCSLFIDKQRYEDYAISWNHLCQKLISHTNERTPQTMPLLHRKPTTDEVQRMLSRSGFLTATLPHRML